MINFIIALTCISISLLCGFILGLIFRDSEKSSIPLLPPVVKINLEVINIPEFEANDVLLDPYYDVPLHTNRPKYRRALKAYSAQLPEKQDKCLKSLVDC